MASEKIIEALNRARARELGVVLQYMRQHYVAQGLVSAEIADIFKDIAKTEMDHAEDLGERISYLGGEPATQPDPVKKSTDLKQMIQDDLDLENQAIKLYKEIIELCRQEGDVTSRRLMEDLLAAEEEHAHEFGRLLAK
jgi:bacterioferritin